MPKTLLTALALTAMVALCVACSDDDTSNTNNNNGNNNNNNNSAVDQGVADTGPAADSGPRVCDTTALLPADNAVGDFARSGQVQVAVNGKQLQDLINGGSEKYEKNSFKCMSLATYASATKKHKVEVWLFNQTGAAGAAAAYKATEHPDDQAISPAVGDAARENTKLLFEYTADLRKGAYVARVKIDDKAGAADGPLFLKALAAAIK